MELEVLDRNGKSTGRKVNLSDAVLELSQTNTLFI